MTTPISSSPDWAAAQASPWLTVNEMARRVEAGARKFIIADRDLTAPPGSCADGACYLIAATATGAWATHDGQLAISVGVNAASGWYFLTVAVEGVEIWVQDENLLIRYDGAAWVDASPVVSLDDLDDVLIVAPQSGDVLVFDEDYDLWVNEPADLVGGGGGAGAITAIKSATVATAESLSSASYADLATAGPSVTLTTGEEVVVMIDARIIPTANRNALIAVEVSGATTIAAADANGLETTALAGAYVVGSRIFKISGLTPGANVFTMKYRTNTGGACEFAKRDITVMAI